jgi:peptide/nickel transport system permease protein
MIRTTVATRVISNLNVATHPKVLLGLVSLSLLFLLGLAAPLLAPYDPNLQNLRATFSPPSVITGVGQHPLGTDSLGRDVLSRLIYGARTALFVGTLGAIFAGLLGTLVGMIAGYVRGRVDEALMRVVDIWMSVPTVVMAVALITVLGVGVENVTLAIIVIDWTRFARVIRSQVLTLRERDFVQAAKAIGYDDFTVIFREIVPNVIHLFIVLFTLEMTVAINVEVLLTFVGFGVKAETPSWGAMISEGIGYVRTAWWIALVPLALIIFINIGLNLLGDGLREKLDPKHVTLG